MCRMLHNLFQVALNIIIPPANEVAGVYSDPYVRSFVRPLVRPAVRLSVRPPNL